MPSLRDRFQELAEPRPDEGVERGATTIEYAAMVLLAALVVVAVSPGPIGERLAETLQAAICRIGGGSCEVGGTALTDADFAPGKCTLSQRTYQGDAAVTVKFIEVGKGIEYARTELSDGTTEFSIVDRSRLGAGVDLGSLAHAGVGITARLGPTWVVDAEEADDFERRFLAREGFARTVEGVADGAGPLARWVSDRVLGDPGPPERQFMEVAVDASAGAGWPPDDHSVTGMSGAPELSVDASVGAVLGREVDRKGSDDPMKWTQSTYVQVDAAASGTVGFLKSGAGHSGVVKVERDARGQIVSVTTESSVPLEAGAAGDREWQGAERPVSGSPGSATERRRRSFELGASASGVQVETVTIPIDSAADRRVAEDWVGSWSSVRSAATGSVEASEPLAALARAKGTIVESSYDDHRLAAAADVDAGGSYGVSGGISMTDRSPVSQQFRGAPDATGHRALVPLDCG